MAGLQSGYTPLVHMPVIDAAQNFAAIVTANSVTASQNGHYALDIDVTDAAHHKLYAMAGSVVYFVPHGAATDPFFLYDRFPDLPPLSPGTGYLLCGLWPADFSRLQRVLPVGVPAPLMVVYFNVDPTSVVTALEPVVQEMPDKALTDDPLVGDHQQHVNDYLARVQLGEAGVFVTGGTHVGNMAGNRLTLFFSGADHVSGLSPILHIRGMPDYGDPKWANHPLIEAVSTLPVPVDIYLQFEVWNPTAQSFKPLPGGMSVDLVDDDVVLDATLLTTTTDASGNGQAHFSTADLQAIDGSEPDLYFQVHLGSDNPDPSLISDPWSTEEWVRLMGVWPYHTGDGYYGDFAGTRLGDPTHPLLFHIGLGYWADLISHRPPVSVQQQLHADSRAVHFIEDPGGNPTPTEPGWDPPINLDYYPIRVTTLPTIDNQVLTPMEVLRHIRLEINTLVDASLFGFTLKDPTADSATWTSTDPADAPALQQLLGIVLTIDFYGMGVNADNGSVVVSDIDTAHFTFSTIWTPFFEDLNHPVSGNREIGFAAQPDGSWVFYTRGADRPTTRFDDEMSAIEFRGADVSWKSLQRGVADFVNGNGGVAVVEPAFSVRFPWKPVKKVYWNPATPRL